MRSRDNKGRFVKAEKTKKYHKRDSKGRFI